MISDVKKSTEQKMKKTLEALKTDLAKVRTGRAHAGLLDHVMVDYYGTPTPIPQVANANLIDARTIGVVPWDKKMVAVVEKAIRDSDLGLNPASQGDTVRVPMPPLTEERRKELIKVVRSECLSDTKFLTRFKREMEVTTRLRHPSTIRVFEHGSAEDGRPYMVMELLTGESLAERLERGKIPEIEALQHARQIA